MQFSQLDTVKVRAPRALSLLSLSTLSRAPLSMLCTAPLARIALVACKLDLPSSRLTLKIRTDAHTHSDAACTTTLSRSCPRNSAGYASPPLPLPSPLLSLLCLHSLLLVLWHWRCWLCSRFCCGPWALSVCAAPYARLYGMAHNLMNSVENKEFTLEAHRRHVAAVSIQVRRQEE
jgi:hypothetical protein